MAADIAQDLGAARRCGEWWRCVCPVHGSRTGRSATLALRDGDRGLIVHCPAGCGRDEILDELRRRGLISAPSRERGALRSYYPATRAKDANESDRIGSAWRIWNAGLDAHGSPVAAYLAGRGIVADPPPSLRWMPRLRRPDGTYGPGMVAFVQHVERGFVGVHRTWLERDAAGVWRRLDRASLGPIGGGGVLLASVADTVMVGEGIESCMGAMLATGLPAYAALSAGGIEWLILPITVRYVTILGDNDSNLRGQKAPWKAAQRWTAEGRSVRIAMPPEPDTDFNDLLTKYAASRGEGNIHA
jgi:hypothetical protein